MGSMQASSSPQCRLAPPTGPSPGRPTKGDVGPHTSGLASQIPKLQEPCRCDQIAFITDALGSWAARDDLATTSPWLRGNLKVWSRDSCSMRGHSYLKPVPSP